jgi:hypothetical protein
MAHPVFAHHRLFAVAKQFNKVDDNSTATATTHADFFGKYIGHVLSAVYRHT